MTATSPDTAPQNPGTMTWLEHLLELRGRLIKASLAVLLGIVVGWTAVAWDHYLLLKWVTDRMSPEGVQVQTTEVAELFTSALSVALGIGLSLAMPVILYQLLAFIVPGLTRRERRVLFLILPFITLCFAGGLVFGWYVTVPAALNWLLVQGADRFLIQPKISNFMSIMTRLMLLNGILFEMPVLVYSIIWLGVVDRKLLTRYRRYAILVITILAAMVTPTADPINLALVALPMYLLYELGLLLALIAPRRQTVHAGHRED